MELKLVPITKENFEEALELSVKSHQEKFVASNVYSIAQSRVEPLLNCRGIYDGDTMVGFILEGYSHDGDDLDGYWIEQFMLDSHYQHQGYGREALVLLLDDFKAAGIEGVYISVVPGNEGAERLYRSLGFEDTGKLEDGEKVFWLDLTTFEGAV